MKKMTFLKIVLAVMGAFQFSTAQADDCTSIYNDAANWLAQSEPNYQRYVGFMISSLKAPAKFVSYGAGSLELVQADRVGLKFLRGKNIMTTFSDRTWCPELAAGSLCTGYQPFNYKAKDTQQLYLYGNNTAKIVLTTWNNATYTVPLTCSNGFMYGTLVEPNGNSMVVINLNKGKIAIPR